jgi:TIR domain
MAESSSITPLRVFLSYSSEQTNIAEQVYFSLKSSGHDVFFDRTNLRPGEEYNRAILDRIRSSDLFVFLISPSSIQESAYTRTEMRFARDTWPNPEGRVLPVLAVPTDFSQIPNYLKAVTILRPDGNLPAEVSASVNDLAAGRTPQDTIAGKAELIAKVAIATEQLQRSGRATAIDKQWDIDRKKLFATDESETTKRLAILVPFGIIFVLIFFFITPHSPHQFPVA